MFQNCLWSSLFADSVHQVTHCWFPICADHTFVVVTKLVDVTQILQQKLHKHLSEEQRMLTDHSTSCPWPPKPWPCFREHTEHKDTNTLRLSHRKVPRERQLSTMVHESVVVSSTVSQEASLEQACWQRLPDRGFQTYPLVWVPSLWHSGGHWEEEQECTRTLSVFHRYVSQQQFLWHGSPCLCHFKPRVAGAHIQVLTWHVVWHSHTHPRQRKIHLCCCAWFCKLIVKWSPSSASVQWCVNKSELFSTRVTFNTTKSPSFLCTHRDLTSKCFIRPAPCRCTTPFAADVDLTADRCFARRECYHVLRPRPVS